MKEIKLKSFINKSGTHAISVCGINEHGSGPFKTISIKIKSVPLTVDLEEVALVNTNDNIVNEVLSCGSTITVKVKTPMKKLPETITINSKIPYQYTIDSTNPTQAILEFNAIDIEEITKDDIAEIKLQALEDYNNLTNTTWYLNNTIHKPSYGYDYNKTYNITFVCDGVTYNSIRVVGAYSGAMSVYYDGVLAYANSSVNNPLQCKNEKYRTITITGGSVNDTTTISWLKSNGILLNN